MHDAARSREIEQAVADMLAAGRARWPEITLDALAFADHVTAQIAEGATAEHVRDLRAADLYLACACAGGDAKAIAAFEGEYFGEVERAAKRLRATADQVTEVRQILRRILFVREGARRAAVAGFAGRGDLRGWVRVTAMRELLRLLGSHKREVQVSDLDLLDALAPTPLEDPELARIGELYRQQVAAAVKDAIGEASARERALLRYHLIDGLQIDHIAKLYGVHRATVSRWLSDARSGIFERSRTHLAKVLGVDCADVDSIIGLVRSRLDVSLERILASTTGSAAER